MRSATFLLNKHPYAQPAGDTRVSRLLIEVAAEPSVAVRGWRSGRARRCRHRFELCARPKPPVRSRPLAARALSRRPQHVHSRYLTDELVRAVAEDSGDGLIAEHIYMAEAALAADRAGPGLMVNAHVLESSVLEARAGSLARVAPLRLEARAHPPRRAPLRAGGGGDRLPRRVRPRRRCGRPGLATSAGSISSCRRCRAAPLTGPPLALFVGDRGWRAERRRGPRRCSPPGRGSPPRVPEAELVVAGRPARGERPPAAAGVRWLGFVDDLDELYAAATVLLAPVAIGGGVRVKILEAAARGIPVVATGPALGSIGDYLPVAPVAETGELSTERRELLRRSRSGPGRRRRAVRGQSRALWGDRASSTAGSRPG